MSSNVLFVSTSTVRAVTKVIVAIGGKHVGAAVHVPIVGVSTDGLTYE